MSDQDQNDSPEITVMRTSDAKKLKVSISKYISCGKIQSYIANTRCAQLELSLSSSLNDLKDAIDASPEFGPLPRNHQRIFHLGRELKTGGRSLSTLGIGRFHVFTIHLLANTPTEPKPKKPSQQLQEPLPRQKRRARSSHADSIIEVLSDSDDDDVVEVVPSSKRRRC